MPIESQELAKRVLRREWEHLSQHERHVIEAVLNRMPVSRNMSRESLEARSLGERLADQIARFGGSWTFILLFLGFLLAWAVLNTEILAPRNAEFDPYPYIFLNLFLSMLAALQAPIIMMAQNRQATRDRLAAQQDYEVNLKAEIEIRTLHDKLDALREAQWMDLVRMQQDQIRLLEALLARADGQLPATTPARRDESR